MSDRPQIYPNVLASIAENVPDRVRKKLDKEPTVAQDWVWVLEGTTWTIEAGNEKVTPFKKTSSAVDPRIFGGLC